MKLMQLGALLALALVPQTALAGGVTLEGYQQRTVPYPGTSNTRTLSTGDIITFDGQSVDLYTGRGDLIRNLTTLPASVFSGLFVVDPTETFIVLGESSNGDVFRIEIATGVRTLLTNLTFNYDADFGPDGMVYVSAALGGFGVGNDILRLNPLTGVTTALAHVAGSSGPLEFDLDGNLYYATQDPGFPAPAGSTDILVFPAPVLASADCQFPSSCLSEADAFRFGVGYDGASDLALDPQSGVLYMIENNYGSGASRVWRVQGGTPSLLGPIIEEANGNGSSNLDVVGGTSAKLLLPFQPTSDARMYYNTTDYGSLSERIELRAKRPGLAISGPGVSGRGIVNLDVTDASMGGGVLFAYGPTANLAPQETAFPITGLSPLFSDLNPGTIQVYGSVLPLGAGNDSLSLSFMNPGGLEGLLSIQVLLIDTSFTQFIGTTNRVDL